MNNNYNEENMNEEIYNNGASLDNNNSFEPVIDDNDIEEFVPTYEAVEPLNEESYNEMEQPGEPVLPSYNDAAPVEPLKEESFDETIDQETILPSYEEAAPVAPLEDSSTEEQTEIADSAVEQVEESVSEQQPVEAVQPEIPNTNNEQEKTENVTPNTQTTDSKKYVPKNMSNISNEIQSSIKENSSLKFVFILGILMLIAIILMPYIKVI